MARKYISRRKLGKVTHGVGTPEESARVAELVAECEKEYGVQVNFRWEHDQMQLVRQAAALMGVSVSQYIKVALYRQSMADLKEAQAMRYTAEERATGLVRETSTKPKNQVSKKKTPRK